LLEEILLSRVIEVISFVITWNEKTKRKKETKKMLRKNSESVY